MLEKRGSTSLLLLFCLTFLADFSIGEDWVVPQKAFLGQPFLVRFQSKAALEEVKLRWLGKEATLRAEKTIGTPFWQVNLILGTDVRKDKPRVHKLHARLFYRDGIDERDFSIGIIPKKYPVQRLKVAKHLVTLSSSSLKRVRRERVIIGRALRRPITNSAWRFPFHRPVDGLVCGEYGVRRFFNGLARSPHSGVDFDGTEGTEVRAINGGRIILTGHHFFAGKSVYVDHGGGLISAYFHLSKTLVKEGQEVEKGQTVGLMGATGRSTKAHLHLSLYSFGRAINSLPLFEEGGPFWK